MARPLRLEFPGAVYHVTSRGNARQDIVADDRDRTAWLSLLAQVIDRYGCLCHAIASWTTTLICSSKRRRRISPSA
jgi:hypothetical protein